MKSNRSIILDKRTYQAQTKHWVAYANILNHNPNIMLGKPW